jgi:23S rRNA pseudouridine1911/1915/1917 synthase
MSMDPPRPRPSSPDPRPAGPGRVEFQVDADGDGERLDRWLTARIDLSRTRIAALVSEGKVHLNDGVPRKAEPLSTGDRIVVEIPEPEEIEARPQDLPLEILHEDPHLLVVNKPAGMVVHPARGHPEGTLVNALLHHVSDLSGIGGKLRPGIVHRLDRDTSGLLVVAKDDRTHRVLSDALRKRKVRRLYRALSWGHLRSSPTTVDAPLGRHPHDRTRRAVVEGGKRSVTHLRVREQFTAAELLDVALETGRTHQIRVHLAHLGHPVVGDTTYGEGWGRGMGGTARGWAQELERRMARHFLHARRLSFRHPESGELMDFQIPFPEELESVLEWARRTRP